MEHKEDNENVTWLIEELNNGITIEDEDMLFKEAAVVGSDFDSDKNIKSLLSRWFYRELKNEFLRLDTTSVRVTLHFEEAL